MGMGRVEMIRSQPTIAIGWCCQANAFAERASPTYMLQVLIGNAGRYGSVCRTGALGVAMGLQPHCL